MPCPDGTPVLRLVSEKRFISLDSVALARKLHGEGKTAQAWARVSDEVHARLETGNHRLRPEEWNSGSHPWLIDIAAPPKALPQVLAELQMNVFKGEKVRTLLKSPTIGRGEMGQS